MAIKVEHGTRSTDHICEDCRHCARIGHVRESDDEHFCTAQENGRWLRLTKVVVECTKFSRVKMRSPDLNNFDIWQMVYANDGTPVFLAPGEGGMSYEKREQYINNKAARMNKQYGPVIKRQRAVEVDDE